MGKGKYTLRSIIVRCVVIMVGVFITAYGAEAFVLANLGSDPVTAFVQGLSKVLPFVHGDFGMAMNVFNVLCFVVILIVYRKGIGVATVLYTFTLGTFCSMMEPWIIALPRHSGHHRHAGSGRRPWQLSGRRLRRRPL